jgi:hypothetical protein
VRAEDRIIHVARRFAMSRTEHGRVRVKHPDGFPESAAEEGLFTFTSLAQEPQGLLLEEAHLRQPSASVLQLDIDDIEDDGRDVASGWELS